MKTYSVHNHCLHLKHVFPVPEVDLYGLNLVYLAIIPCDQKYAFLRQLIS